MTKSRSSKRLPESHTSQGKRFIETARELGCDEDEAAFDEKLKRIATVKPKQEGAYGKLIKAANAEALG
jgi:hypothetical protein